MDEALSANQSLALSDAFEDRAVEDGFFARGLELEEVEPASEKTRPEAGEEARPDEPRCPRWLLAISVCLLLAVLSAGVLDAVPGLLQGHHPNRDYSAEPEAAPWSWRR